MKLAFLGTGLIGGAMAEAAAKRGHSVVAWNRTLAKAQALEAHGIVVAETPDAACRGAERIHLALPDDDAVEAVLAAAGAVDGVVIDHTTGRPDRTAARAGGRYLHAPVFMSPQNCRDAKGIMLVSGPEALFREVEAGLREMTGKVLYLGPRPDKAAALKLFGNAALISLIAGFADVLAMATEVGIEPVEVLGLFEHFNPAASLAYRGRAMAEGRYAPSFELTMARKDLRLMLETAGDRPLAALPGIADRMDALIDRGFGHDDMGILSIDSIPRRP